MSAGGSRPPHANLGRPRAGKHGPPVPPSRTNLIRAARIARGLTMDQLAARCGLTVERLRDLERLGGRTDRLRVGALILLARALRCRPTDLVPALGHRYGLSAAEPLPEAAGPIDERRVMPEEEAPLPAPSRTPLDFRNLPPDRADTTP